MNVGGFPRVQGDLVSNGWNVKCWNLPTGMVCNPNNVTGQLQRCPFTESDPCNINNPDWPTVENVKQAIQMSNYDVSSYDKYSRRGFRNYMEGFVVLSDSDIASCGQNRLCLCDTGGSQCTGNNASTPIARVLHNSVSLPSI